jgi:segregation and condensation protein B
MENMGMEKMGMDKPLKLIVESLLFAAENPISPREIHAWLPEHSLSDIKQAFIELTEEYDNMERSFVLREVAQGYQLRSRSAYAPYILRMMKSSTTRLSRAAMETLAIIAYKQPILRHEVERLRGVDVGGILKTLMEKKLIKIMGRKNLPGRPLIYGTTKKFLEVFDLKDLDSLPKIKEIKDFGPDEEQNEFVPETEIRPEPGSEEEPVEPVPDQDPDLESQEGPPADEADTDTAPEEDSKEKVPEGTSADESETEPAPEDESGPESEFDPS